MSRPRLLDLFCKAGGAAMGYHLAGFEVVGVDIEPQPNYPFEFCRADAFRFPLEGFDAIHASPVCKLHTRMKAFSATGHPNQIPLIRRLLTASELPYIIENVPGAPLRAPVVLCGSMFGLGVRRLVHLSSVVSVFGRGQGLGPGESELWRKAMGIDWMVRDELSQAIPPAYTEHLGKQLLAAVLVGEAQ